jgi:uncharacterized protein (DUF924 family)
MANGEAHEEVLRYWLGSGIPEPSELRRRMRMWFRSDPDLDAEISVRFAAVIEQASDGRLGDWAATPTGRLALIIVLDQFRRNVYRATKEAFACDGTALTLARDGLARTLDAGLSVMERAFFYMPLQHAEELAAQETSVTCFRRLLDDSPPELQPTVGEFLTAAQQHRALVERFGRFPHRNAVLGRECTPAELAYLSSTGAVFRK